MTKKLLLQLLREGKIDFYPRKIKNKQTVIKCCPQGQYPAQYLKP